MKRVVTTLSALALALALGIANADEAKGQVQEISPDNTWFTLSDGTKFSIAEGVSMEGLKPGAQVTVSYEEREGAKVATKISGGM